jgi:hypothetical protein
VNLFRHHEDASGRRIRQSREQSDALLAARVARLVHESPGPNPPASFIAYVDRHRFAESVLTDLAELQVVGR